jgi:hypothetical protein
MPVQDDAREIELRRLFALEDSQGGRSGVDAYLRLDGELLPFELKSTTKGAVTTVRDFGPDHIAKWVGKHWLIGVYSRDQLLQHTIYVSPKNMEPWIRRMEEYISLDFKLASLVPSLINIETLYEVLSEKEVYSIQDARNVQKMQHTVDEYRAMVDLTDGISPNRMLEILRGRCRYLIARGSTLNNPHIPKEYISRFPAITENHPAELERLVRSAMAGG